MPTLKKGSEEILSLIKTLVNINPQLKSQYINVTVKLLLFLSTISLRRQFTRIDRKLAKNESSKKNLALSSIQLKKIFKVVQLEQFSTMHARRVPSSNEHLILENKYNQRINITL